MPARSRDALDVAEARAAQELLDRVRLPGADLERERTARAAAAAGTSRRITSSPSAPANSAHAPARSWATSGGSAASPSAT